jgi:glycopeptide antibiotics resistance protein
LGVNDLIEGISLDKEILFVFGIPICVVIRVLMIIIKKKKKAKVTFRREMLLGLFVIYLFALAGVTLFPIDIYWANNRGSFISFYINCIPFRSIIQQINGLGNGSFSIGFQFKLLLRNVGGNIILLTPLSILLPILWSKYREFKYCFLFSALTSLLIEILQFVENTFGVGRGRVCDIDDLILNTIGAVTGYWIFRLINSKFNLTYGKHFIS